MILGVAIDDESWMIDDGLSVVGLAVMRLWGDGKSKRCLMLVELELNTCQDWHPCLSMRGQDISANFSMKILTTPNIPRNPQTSKIFSQGGQLLSC